MDKSKWNSFKKAVLTGVKKVVSGVKRVAAKVVSGVKKAVMSASTWVRNKYRGYTNTARNTYRRTKKWVHNTARTVSQRVRSTSHSVVKHTRNFVNNHRKEIEITRNIVAIASIAVLAIPAAPAMAIVALGVLEVGLDLAAGDNTSAAVGLLCLFPMGKGFKYVTEIGGDAIKGGSKAKNLYKAEGLLKMDLQKFGKGAAEAVKWKGFSKGELAEHFTKHGNEFGDITQNQYLKLAKDFAAESNSAFRETKVGNFIIKYDEATRRVLVGQGKSREIRTFYKADFRDADPFEAAVNLAKELSGIK